VRTVAPALVAVALLPALAAAQGSVRIYVPTPTPTHRPGFGGVAPNVANIPLHAPDRLEFGAVWDGEKQVRTFSLTSNGRGYLSAEIPKGPFHIVEYRELGLPIRSKDGQKVGKNVKVRIPYADTESRALSWQIDPDVDVEIDVAFNPKFDLFSMTAGDKSLALTVRGPGPFTGWQLSIPLHGVFHGLRGGVLLRAGDDVDVVEPASTFRKTVTLVGAPDRDVTGVLHASLANPAAEANYVRANDVTVTVPKGRTIEATMTFQLLDWWHPSWTRPIGRVDLAFTAGAAISRDTFTFTPWRSRLKVDTTFRTGHDFRDCGPAGPMSAWIELASDGRVTMQAWWNIDGFEKDPGQAVHFQFLANGAIVAEAIFRKTQMSQVRSSSVPSQGLFAMRFTPGDFVRVYKAYGAGKVDFACRTVPGNTFLP
jgi:hypothetical protein